jgi:hypothetical protein
LDNNLIWNVCDKLIRGTGEHCKGCVEQHDNIPSCFVKAVEIINVVQTGNPWAKTIGPRLTEINGNEEKTCQGCPERRTLQGIYYCRYLGNKEVVDYNRFIRNGIKAFALNV